MDEIWYCFGESVERDRREEHGVAFVDHVMHYDKDASDGQLRLEADVVW